MWQPHLYILLLLCHIVDCQPDVSTTILKDSGVRSLRKGSSRSKALARNLGDSDKTRNLGDSDKTKNHCTNGGNIEGSDGMILSGLSSRDSESHVKSGGNIENPVGTKICEPNSGNSEKHATSGGNFETSDGLLSNVFNPRDPERHVTSSVRTKRTGWNPSNSQSPPRIEANINSPDGSKDNEWKTNDLERLKGIQWNPLESEELRVDGRILANSEDTKYDSVDNINSDSIVIIQSSGLTPFNNVYSAAFRVSEALWKAIPPHPVFKMTRDSWVGEITWRTLKEDIPKCYHVLVTQDSKGSLAYHILSWSSILSKPLLIVDISQLPEDRSAVLSTGVWGDSTTTCRVVMVDLTSDDFVPVLDFLETAKLWLWPESQVIIIGKKSEVHSAMTQSVLRNSVQPVFIGLGDEFLSTPQCCFSYTNPWKLISATKNEISSVTESADTSPEVSVYTRCLYCNNGKQKVKLIQTISPGSEIPEQFIPDQDHQGGYHGHLFHVVSMTLFPYSDYQKDSDAPATTVTLKDSLDKRMLDTFAAHLNFSYEVRTPWDMQWGVPAGNGNWTGLLGTIQHNKADFTTVMSFNPGRLTIVDPARAYAADRLALVSHKPQVLPRYTVLVRPFTVDVWLYLLSCIILWGVVLWLLQKTWSEFASEPGFSFSLSIFTSWAIILEDPPLKLPTNIAGQTLVGWWLLSSLVISTGFKSSLVAHLTVESKESPLDTFEDLIQRSNWKWGIQSSMLTGGPKFFFTSSHDPVVKHIYKHLESLEEEDALAKALRGGYTYLALKNYVTTTIASHYTDSAGRTPYYISKHGHKILSDFGWGFRKGTPFRSTITILMLRLDEAGLIRYWLSDIITLRVKQIKMEEAKSDKHDHEMTDMITESDQPHALSMSHVIGVFFVLILGSGFAALVLAGEIALNPYIAKKYDA